MAFALKNWITGNVSKADAEGVALDDRLMFCTDQFYSFQVAKPILEEPYVGNPIIGICEGTGR